MHEWIINIVSSDSQHNSMHGIQLDDQLLRKRIIIGLYVMWACLAGVCMDYGWTAA